MTEPPANAGPAEKNSFSDRNQNRRERIVFVTDSNGDDIDAPRLKPGAEVRKKTRYRIKEAIRLSPKVTNPHEINDVVFQIGLNDLREGLDHEEIADQYVDMQLKYKKQFPNARQHVTALPPLGKDHINVNKTLQKLAQNLGCNFISAKAFTDHATGKIRSNLMRGFHYNNVGIRHLAKEIKKSLFSTANRESKQLSQLVELRQDDVNE